MGWAIIPVTLSDCSSTIVLLLLLLQYSYWISVMCSNIDSSLSFPSFFLSFFPSRIPSTNHNTKTCHLIWLLLLQLYQSSTVSSERSRILPSPSIAMYEYVLFGILLFALVRTIFDFHLAIASCAYSYAPKLAGVITLSINPRVYIIHNKTYRVTIQPPSCLHLLKYWILLHSSV